MPFTYDRTIHFSDTDAAGVVYFANVLSICHESYEALLASSGMDLKEFFSGRSIAVPIVHASVDFLHPMRCGDLIQVQLKPTEIKASKFRLDYTIFFSSIPSHKPASNSIAATAHTIHVCIKTDRPALGHDAQRQDDRREKTELPEALKQCLFQTIE